MSVREEVMARPPSERLGYAIAELERLRELDLAERLRGLGLYRNPSVILAALMRKPGSEVSVFDLMDRMRIAHADRRHAFQTQLAKARRHLEAAGIFGAVENTRPHHYRVSPEAAQAILKEIENAHH